jgi:hypothetical protein
MNINNPLFRHALIFGAALGITLSIFELLGFFLGILTQPIMSFINIAIVTSMLIIAIRKYRDQNLEGFISFGKAFLLGLITSLIAGAIWSFYRLIEYSLAPQIIDDMLVVIEEKLLETSIAEDQIESMMKLYSIIYTAPILAISTFLFNMGFGGAILNLILAAIFKREENPLLTDSNK